MTPSAPRLIPVLIEFRGRGDRPDSWGKLLEVRASGASLLTRARLERGDALRLRFDLPGERLEGVAAEVAKASRDRDGYSVGELRFPDEELRVRLGRTLRRILAAGA